MAAAGYGIELSKTPIQTQMSLAIDGSGYGPKAIALDVSNSSDVVHNGTTSDQNTGAHSKFKAGLYSFLVPGWGQYYNNQKTKVRIFLGAEVITWVTYFSLRTYGAWKKNDMIRQAEEKAGANLDGKNDDFFVWLEIYHDIDQYNDLGRLVEPGAEYYPDDASHHWRWQSAEDQATFRDLREASRSAYRRANWVLLVGLFDRVLAVVNAIRDAHGRKQDDEGFQLSVAGKSIHLHVDPLAGRSQVAFTIYPGF